MPLQAHEKLDVYHLSLDVILQVDDLLKRLPKGRAYLTDQFHRAVLSVPLNIAEGAGEFSPAEKARFYRIALRSATECSALVDVCEKLGLLKTAERDDLHSNFSRIIAMLTRMAANASERSNPGRGTGTGRGINVAERSIGSTKV